jgi:hypothetical protein
MIATRLTERFGLTAPVVCAPMARAAGASSTVSHCVGHFAHAALHSKTSILPLADDRLPTTTAAWPQLHVHCLQPHVDHCQLVSQGLLARLAKVGRMSAVNVPHRPHCMLPLLAKAD